MKPAIWIAIIVSLLVAFIPIMIGIANARKGK